MRCERCELEYSNSEMRTTVVCVYCDPVRVIAYFVKDGSVQCPTCVGYKAEPNAMWDGVSPVKIFVENLRPYSQNCHKCNTLVYKGTSPVILFERRPIGENV